VRKATTTPLEKVRSSIRATLLQEKRTEVMTEWVKDLESDYEDKVSYAAGYAPPEIPEETAGPYPGDGSNGPNALTESGVVRSDITSSFGGATGGAAGPADRGPSALSPIPDWRS